MIDPASNKLVAEVPVGPRPGGDHDRRGRRLGGERRGRDGLADRPGRCRGHVRATIPVGGYPSDLTVGAGSVWVALGALGRAPSASTRSRTTPRARSRRSVKARLLRRAVREHRASAPGALWFVCRAAQLRSRRTLGRESAIRAAGSGNRQSSSSVLPAVLGRRLRSRVALDRRTARRTGRRGRPADDAGASGRSRSVRIRRRSPSARTRCGSRTSMTTRSRGIAIAGAGPDADDRRHSRSATAPSTSRSATAPSGS